MLELLCGEPGSGKTEYLINNAKKLLEADPGAKLLFIVPEQETVSAESRIFSCLPPYAPLTVEVDNFSRLADSVFRKVGGVAREHVGKNAKKLCMWKTLKLFPKQGCSYESVNSVLSTVNELASCGATPEKLAAAAERLEGEERLSALLKEYSLISSVYSAFVTEIGYDTQRDGEQLNAALIKYPLFADTEIIIDGFTSFTGIEYEIISRLTEQAKKVTVTLGGDPDSDDIWLGEIKQCAATLVQNEEKNGRSVTFTKLEGNKRTLDPDLLKLSTELWSRNAEICNGVPQSIRIINCRTPMDEADTLACDIARLIRQGVKYNEIAVAVRNMDDWRGVLDTALEDHGIPAFISAGDKLEDHFAVRFICRAAAAVSFDRDSIAAMLKTGCTGLSADDCDQYLKYAKTWKIGKKDYLSDVDFTMDPEGYVVRGERVSKGTEYVLASVNRVRRRVRELLFPMYEVLAKDGCTVKDAFTELYRFIERAELCRLLKKMAKEAKGEEANRYARVWNAILAALDTAVSSAGDEAVTATELPVLTRLIFSDTSLSAIPTSTDAVTVGSADMLRTSGVKYMYLVGACEGEFPASVTGKGFLSRREQQLLEKEGISLSRDVSMLASRELYVFRRALSYAGCGVTVLYHSADMRGEKCVQSSAVSNIKKLFCKLDEIKSDDLTYTLSSVWDGYGAARTLGMTKDADLAAAIEKATGTTVPNRFLPAFTLSGQVCDLLFDKSLDMSQTRVENFAKCHFMYFCRFILDLKPEAAAEFSYSSNGTYIHAMLERLVPEMSKEKLSAEEIASRIGKYSEEYFNSLIPERDRSDPRLAAQFKRMTDAVRPIAESLDEELRSAAFVPAGAEIAISADEDTLPRPISLPLENGRELRLFGSVDRADTLQSGEDTYVRVIDYKTNDKVFRLKNVEDGINLQLLIYLLTLCKDTRRSYLDRMGCKGERLLPGGMLYCVTKPPEVSVNTPPSEEEYAKMVNGAANTLGIVVDTEPVLKATGEKQLQGFKPIEGEKDSPRILLTPEEFEELGNKTEAKLIKIANSLASGNVLPQGENGPSTACQYCDYYTVCGKMRERRR